MLDLRPYQSSAIDAVNQAEREGVRRPIVVHPTGTGKGHPLGIDVLTSAGWRKWGDLAPGDRVFGSSGITTEVTAVYDRGVLPTYRVTFSDGASIEVDGDHLWAVRDHRYRRTSREHRVLSTHEIASRDLMFGSSRRWAIPMTAIMHEIGGPLLPIDPYTLGALIANGSMIGPGTQLTTPDDEVVTRIRQADRHVINRGKLSRDGQCPRYSLPGLSGRIRELGLNVHSRDKFIPESYLLAGPWPRQALLQGLMDGDGSSREGRRTANYHTTSPRLAEDVRNLVMSLGGTATVNSLDRKHGDGRDYQDITVMIMAPSWLDLFGSSRKKNRTAPRRTFEPRRTIVAIDRVEDQEIRCITVAAPDHLYVVGRDFIVTHNTVTFCHLIEQRAHLGRSLVLVHRDELAGQAVDKLRFIAPELTTGVVKADRNEVGADVVVASVQTVHRDNRLAQLGSFSTVIVDEAHHAPAPTWKKVLTGVGSYSPVGPLTVGFTATPERDGKSLGVWEKVVSYMSIREAIYGGYLCGIHGQTVQTSMDLGKVRKTGGDYADGSLGDALESSGAIEEIADAYVKYAKDRKGVAFTPTVKTAHSLADALNARGIVSEALDGTMAIEDRRAILARLKSGQTQVVVNCAVLTEGFDEPSISCVVVARPTKFHGLYVQMVGRGTRIYPGKSDLLVLDVTGASERHDLVAVVDLGLDDEAAKRKKRDGESEEQTCPSCGVPASECNLPHHRCRMCTRFLPKRLVQEGEVQHETCRAGRTAKIDVFASSRLRWLPVGDAWCLGAGQEVVVMAPAGTDTWRLAAYRNGRVQVLHEQLPVDWAQGIGEDRAKAFQKLVERDARWLGQRPTDAQLGRLIREGFPEAKLDRVRTRGDAADLITRIQGRRAVRKLTT